MTYLTTENSNNVHFMSNFGTVEVREGGRDFVPSIPMPCFLAKETQQSQRWREICE